MLINKPQEINPNFKINKREIQNLLKPQTQKPKDENGTRVYPFLPVSICENLIQQSVLLSTCINTLSEDVVFNNVNILSFDNKENDDEAIEIKKFWEDNQEEIKNVYTDYFSYGFGGAEVVFENDKPKEICQIPAETLSILKESKRNEENGLMETSHYAIQEINGKKIKMRIAHLNYDKSDENLPICLWLGKGRKSDFYDYPIWISAFNHVSASVALDMLDAQKINDGNLISGILIIKRPPAPVNENENIEESLEEKMEEKGAGIFTLELVSMNPNIPLEVQYVQISESNYNYLLELGSKCDGKILAIFKIPKARLLIDEGSESMNSNKTNTLYKIYGKELNNRQRPFEKLMSNFNSKYFNYNGYAEIETPVFVDDKETETNITLNLFNNGLITLGQAIKKIFALFPELQNYLEEPIDFNNPVYSERLYNGNPLGFTESSESTRIEDIGDLIEYMEIK